jgi:pilus assembly protein CpaF
MTTSTPVQPTSAGMAAAREDQRRSQYLDIKADIHRKLLGRLNLEALASTDRARAEGEIRALTSNLLAEARAPLTLGEREAILGDVLDEVFGFGPLEPLLRDPTISDILVNTSDHVFVERKGMLERVPAAFQDNQHLMRVIDRIVSGAGRRIDDSTPMVDARLPDGSRVNAIIPPLAVDGPLLSIRRFPAERMKAEDLLTHQTLTPAMIEFLRQCVKSRLNCLVSGGTGSGKTTLLNVLSAFIPGRERIVTVEDAAELQLSQEHVARLETRAPNIEGKGAIKQRQLVINALRMRPDRIIIGEVRGEEALDMLQAMNTGHANTARDALSRIETMIAMANVNLPDKAMRTQIASAIQLVIQQSRIERWHPKGDRHLGDHRDGRGHHHHARNFPVRQAGDCARGSCDRTIRGERRSPEMLRATPGLRRQPPDRHVRGRDGGAVMALGVLVALVFLVSTVAMFLLYALIARGTRETLRERVDDRLQQMTDVVEPDSDGLLKTAAAGPLPVVDRMVTDSESGSALGWWIEQSGVATTPSGLLLASAVTAVLTGGAARVLAGGAWATVAIVVGGLIGFAIPLMVVRQRRASRLYRFEEHFPEALDLISRAVRAGHAFSAGLKMIGDEVDDPVGTEFRKTFEEQNFGLPLADALYHLAARVPLLDVQFFVTAVLIQHDTGGNLAEILDNLSGVVRERFKIRRQVRVHTAHGRMTGYVLMALPVVLLIALSFINPDHVGLLFGDPMGQMMLVSAVVMQAVGYMWIRQVVKIDV